MSVSSQLFLNETINAFDEQTAKLSNIQKAKDALTFDPSSVNQKDKIVKLQIEYLESIDKLNEINKTLQSAQLKTMNDIENTNTNIKKYKETLKNNNLIFNNYDKSIKDKTQLVATRDRMLQLSQERNLYKKKIIYFLLTVIIALIISVMFGYKNYVI